ncbi:DUF4238 domain-containing protein [Clostridium sp.]|uniref:DUF4238 domain-containing protein n=1 Tax=Clostridium sp. TaxID=1506 RepID=UPI00283C49A8|nr:DUF4238 domain-containing protein [Clostridium sp.]MDR3593847.1 DUF4238 domain-containing protein [Clostridium sp.]
MGKSKEQRVIIQHYIPRCILSYFCNDKKQIYEGLVMTKKQYQTNIINSMAERFTYEHSLIEVNFLEKYFQRIESYIGKVYKDINDSLNKNIDNPKEFNEIKKFINRYMKEYLIFYYRSGALLHEFGYENNNREDRILLLLRKLFNSKYIRQLSETVLNNYSFSIIKSVEGKFLVSDQFVSTAALGIKNNFTNVSNRQIGFKKVIILVPISKNYYAVYFHGNTPSYIRTDKINTLSLDNLREINKIIVNNSYVKCVGNDDESLSTALSEFKFQSPITTISRYESGLTKGAVTKKEIYFYKKDEETMKLFSSSDWMKYKLLSRNDICSCGSKKKYKYCHMDNYLELKNMMDHIKYNRSENVYHFPKNYTVELPINEWAGIVDSKKN